MPLWATAGVAALVVVFFVLRFFDKRHEKQVHRFVDADLADRLILPYSLRSRRPLFWLSFFGILFLLLALAQPHWGKKWAPVTRTSRDILILLDVSGSMDADDMLPSRLIRARQKIQSLLETCPADRFGLILFSGEAAYLCPLTLDQGYFRSILDAVDTDTLSVEGSNLTAALVEARDAFEADAKRFGDSANNTRLILLISDGEETAEDAVAEAHKIAAHAVIYTLGIGDPAGSVVEYPQWMRQHVSVPDQQLTHISKLDEDTLTQIALAAKGAYVRITPDNGDIDFLRGEFDAVRARHTSDTLKFRMINRYRWPLAAAWLCFAAEGLWLSILPILRQRRLRRMERASHG